MPDPSKPFIYLAVPCYGGQLTLHFVQSLLVLKDACREAGVGLHVEMMGGESLITRGRSRLAAAFLAHPEATHLLFIDADIGFAPRTVFRLLESGKEVIAAVCPLKKVDWAKVRRAVEKGIEDLQAASIGYVVRFLPNAQNSVEVNDGYAQVAYGGTGFLMITRNAMQRLTDAHPELRAKMRDMADNAAQEAVMVFETMIEPETGQYLSEDYAFCRRWRDLGGEIWADFDARLTHVGHAAYTGRLLDALEAAV
jgi:hypothetical protein